MSTFLKLYNREKHATFFRIAEHHRVGGYREKESTLSNLARNGEKAATIVGKLLSLLYPALWRKPVTITKQYREKRATYNL